VQHRPALQELIDEHPAQVAVLWSPPAPANLLRATAKGPGLDRE
jgi:phage-related protein